MIFHCAATPQADEEVVAVVKDAIKVAPLPLPFDTTLPVVDGQPLRFADNGRSTRVTVYAEDTVIAVELIEAERQP